MSSKIPSSSSLSDIRHHTVSNKSLAPPVVPSYTEIHTSSPNAAGLPVLEIVRKLEEEKILLRDDRAVLKEALYSSDHVRRDKVIKALCEVELNLNSRFAIRRLKAVIHQNNGGEVSSRLITNSNEAPNIESNQKQAPEMAMEVCLPQPSQLGSSVSAPSKFTIPKISMNHKINRDSNGDNSNKLHISLSESCDTFPISQSNKIVVVNPQLLPNNNHSLATQSIASNANNTSQRDPSSISKSSKSPTSISKSSKSSRSPSSISLQHNHCYPRTRNNNSNMIIDDNNDEEDYSIQTTISKVVGEYPLYSGNDHYNVLSKISKRLNDISSKVTIEKLNQMKFAIIIGCGSYNPLTRMHLRTYYLAKEYLESKCGYIVLGALLSPSHSVTVRERYRTNSLEILPAPHRLGKCVISRYSCSAGC
jgi:hypothetical protein